MNRYFTFASPLRAVLFRAMPALMLGAALVCAAGAAEAKTKPKASAHAASKHKAKASAKHSKVKVAHAKPVVRSGATATSASEATAASTERLVSEFAPLVGSNADTESLVTTLRSGRPTSDRGPAAVVPVTGPLGYGEVRLALKLAQGALKQQGINQPNPDQLSAALHGGRVMTAQGEQTLPGVLLQREQGDGWAAIAQGYNMTPEDMMPPARTGPRKATAERQQAHAKTGKAAKGAKAKAGKSAKATKSAKAGVAKKKRK